MPKKLLYGLSLSLCVKDIVLGKVSLSDIAGIISSTKCVSLEDWRKVLDYYGKHYWYELPYTAENIALGLLARGLIYQPRVDFYTSHSIADGHWVEIEVPSE